jgi:hypothetical protein
MVFSNVILYMKFNCVLYQFLLELFNVTIVHLYDIWHECMLLDVTFVKLVQPFIWGFKILCFQPKGYFSGFLLQYGTINWKIFYSRLLDPLY